jgi:NADH-quinone oxidoreductase subunit N
VLCHLERKGDEVESLSDLAGLGRTHPGSAIAMTICLVSLAGLPGTGGFLGKLWVFRAGVASGDIGLVVLALLASGIGLYYYLYVVVVMYMHPPSAGTAASQPVDRTRWGSRIALGIAAGATLLLGVFPQFTKLFGLDLLDLIERGGKALL